MKRSAFVLIGLLALSACGADGEPVQPTANLGVNVSNSGVSAGANVGVRKGPWNISLGRIF